MMIKKPGKTLLAGLLILSSGACSHSKQSHRHIAHFLDAIETNRTENIPLAADVEFRGPLLNEPITGKDAVAEFLSRIAPNVIRLEVKRISTSTDGGCAEVRATLNGIDSPVDEVHCLTLSDGKLSKIELYFDPRPMLAGQKE